MRPGPGLVVMALAFISGARRGTGQQSSSGGSGSISASHSGKLGKFGEDNTGGAGAEVVLGGGRGSGAGGGGSASGGGAGSGGRGALSRINPWLSACDLEPNSAPDLQVPSILQPQSPFAPFLWPYSQLPYYRARVL